MNTLTTYKIKETNNKQFPFLVLFLDESRIDVLLTDIENNFKEKNYNGDVIFDLLLPNGDNDRFYSAFFNGKSFKSNSFKALSNVQRDINSISNIFYLHHFDLIENLCITKSSKFLIKRKFLSS